jgi:flagella basal body P-ring formation protein FlgA
MLRLGDIFEHAGALAPQAVGAAPAPGRRMLLDAANLAAIARRHGLNWRPLSGEERSIVERPGRPVPREEIEALLRLELARLGADPDFDLDLPGFAPPLVPITAPPELALEAPHYEAATRRFAATLVVAAEGMATQRLRIAGRAAPTVPVVLAARRMAVGEVVRPRDIEERRQRAERVRPGMAQRAEDVVGRQLRRPIGTDMPFMTVDLVAPVVIAKNQAVLMLLDAPGLALTAQGRALEAAALGEILPVMNLASRQVVEAEAIGPGRVRVRPGAAPIQVARRG